MLFNPPSDVPQPGSTPSPVAHADPDSVRARAADPVSAPSHPPNSLSGSPAAFADSPSTPVPGVSDEMQLSNFSPLRSLPPSRYFSTPASAETPVPGTPIGTPVPGTPASVETPVPGTPIQRFRWSNEISPVPQASGPDQEVRNEEEKKENQFFRPIIRSKPPGPAPGSRPRTVKPLGPGPGPRRKPVRNALRPMTSSSSSSANSSGSSSVLSSSSASCPSAPRRRSSRIPTKVTHFNSDSYAVDRKNNSNLEKALADSKLTAEATQVLRRVADASAHANVCHKAFLTALNGTVEFSAEMKETESPSMVGFQQHLDNLAYRSGEFIRSTTQLGKATQRFGADVVGKEIADQVGALYNELRNELAVRERQVTGVSKLLVGIHKLSDKLSDSPLETSVANTASPSRKPLDEDDDNVQGFTSDHERVLFNCVWESVPERVADSYTVKTADTSPALSLDPDLPVWARPLVFSAVPKELPVPLPTGPPSAFVTPKTFAEAMSSPEDVLEECDGRRTQITQGKRHLGDC
jgi:hypothetical protein